MRKILIAAGGTGGHLFPAMQLGKILSNESILYAGHKLKTSAFFDKSLQHVEIHSAAHPKGFFQILKGVIQSIHLIRKFHPDVVVGFGSFHTFPILVAAVILRKKIVLFEANLTLGKVNKWFAGFAKYIAVQFPINVKNAVLVQRLPWIKNEKMEKTYVKENEVFTILVFGGSQGAHFLNETFFQAFKTLKGNIRVLHFTGKTDLCISYTEKDTVKPFEKDMKSAYEVADLVICRAGASTIAELMEYKKPAILIPYPYAHNHQMQNTKILKGCVKVLEQIKTNPSILASEIEDMRQNLKSYVASYQNIELPLTTNIEDVIYKVGDFR